MKDGRGRRWASLLAILAVLLHVSVVWADAAPVLTTTPDKSTKPTATSLAGGGFALDFAIWKPEGHGEPKSLSITYKWGSGPERTVSAQRQNDRWHAEFPDQPGSQEQASLALRYEFELSAADWTAVHAAQRIVLYAMIEAVAKARQASTVEAKVAEAELEKSKAARASAEKLVVEAQTKLKIATDKLSSATADKVEAAKAEVAAAQQELTARTSARDALVVAAAAIDVGARAAQAEAKVLASETLAISGSDGANKLRKYGTPSGKSGLAALLTHFDLIETDEGAWAFATSGSKQRLVSLAESLVDEELTNLERDVRVYGQKLANASSEPGCASPGDAGKLDRDAAQALLKACLPVLAVKAKTSQKPEVVQAAKNLEKVPPPAGEALALELDELLEEPTLSSSRAYLSVRLAESTLRKLDRVTSRDAREAAQLAGLDSAFENGTRVQDGATVVQGAAKPRRYDVATGAVYLGGLDDVIVPTLIAVCAWEGCLAPDEVMWDATNGFARSFSFDAGIRLKTLGTQDLRQSDTVSFLVGLSVNPVSVFRLSAGLYAFENAQRDGAWNVVPYAGLTLNVLNAATVLGSLGLNEQLGPKTTEVK